MNRTQPEPAMASPIATLFRSSVSVAVLLALGNVLLLRWDTGAARVRDLGILVLLRKALDTADVHLLALLPASVNRLVDLHSLANTLAFFAIAAVVYIVVLAALAAVLSPLVGLVAARIPATGSVGAWMRTRGYPLGTLALFAAPAALSIVHRMFNTGGSPLISIAVAVSVVAGLWLGLAALVRRPETINRIISIAAMSAVALTIASALGVAALAAFGPTRSGQRQATAAAGLPNILLVSIDSLRRDHLHSYGYGRETSPTLDKLAADGARFETVVAPSSWTLPSHITLLTSLPPEQHGVIETDRRLAPQVPTLSQVLWESGYTTGGFVAGAFLDAMYGYARGFDHYDDYTVVKSFEPASHKGVTSPQLLQITEGWLREWDADGRQRPFFVFLHMWDVHYDYTPPPPYDTMFDPDYRGTATGEDFETGNQVRADMDPRDLEHVIALYDGEIRYTDLYLGKVLDVLKQLGVLDNTIVVVTADHGEEFFEHGMKGHAKQLYDETILVPLLVRFPKKVAPGTVVSNQVRLMDIAPTILTLAGLPIPNSFGTAEPKSKYAERDVSPLIAYRPEPQPPVVAFSDLRGWIGSLRTEQSKLITKHDGGDAELYDLAQDPHEQKNIIGRNPSADGALEDELLAWRQGAHRSAPASERIELSEDHKERLRALGYIR